MIATCDISFYPFTENYKELIIDFIKKIKRHPTLSITTNGMSTHLIGDYDEIIQLLQTELKAILEENKAVFVLKIAPGAQTIENLPEGLK